LTYPNLYELWRLRLFSFGGYGLALAALVLVVFGAIECPPVRPTLKSTETKREKIVGQRLKLGVFKNVLLSLTGYFCWFKRKRGKKTLHWLTKTVVFARLSQLVR